MDGMFGDWWMIPISIVAALIVIWLALAVALWLLKPDEVGIADLLRLLPDVLRLLKRLATDPQLPRRIRVTLIVLLAFIASPIDLIPDFIPVLGLRRRRHHHRTGAALGHPDRRPARARGPLAGNTRRAGRTAPAVRVVRGGMTNLS